jgi:hypothetical protein
MKIKGLSIIAILSLLIVIWINFIEFKFEELIPDKGAKFESLIENLCMSFIAGYMFYALNVYLVERRERKYILPFIARNVINLIVNNYSIICCIRKNQKMDFNFPSKEELNKTLLLINPTEKIPFYYKDKDWLYLFKNRQSSTLDYINRIFLSGKYVDEELRKILLEMQFSLYLKDDYGLNSNEFKEENLSKYSLVIFNHFELLNELYKYYEQNLKQYYLNSNIRKLKNNDR